MGLELQEDGSYVRTAPGMKWRSDEKRGLTPTPTPMLRTAAAMIVEEEPSEPTEPTVANPAPPPAIPLPEQPRPRVHSRSPHSPPYLPGEGPPTDGTAHL